MALALRTGQPFSDVQTWHPRDKDTAWRVLFDQDQAEQDRARDQRFSAATAQVHERMRG